MVSAAAAGPDGAWQGTLAVGQQRVPLVFHFQDCGPVKLCTIDSPMQGANGIPLTVLHMSADSVAVASEALGAAYSGRVADGKIDGTFSQAGYEVPLTLTRELSLQERRPQTPQPPFTYSTRDTTFLAPDGARLAGTITIPEGASARTPIAVLVTGSGKQDRDEELFDHRPFAVIADALARQGIATLRYDDRGAGASEGDFAKADINTNAADAAAALTCARTVFPEGKAGIIGHSEGGTVAFMLAAEGQPDFIVSLAGMAVSGKETLVAQNRRMLQKMGYDSAKVEISTAAVAAAFDQAIDQTRRGVKEPLDVDAIIAQIGAEPPAEVMKLLKTNMDSRTESFCLLLATDPRPLLGRITCPVLAINGTLDTQVDCAANLDAIAQGVPGATVMTFAGLNHLLQHATTGDSSEYIEIRETIAPEVLDAISAFILK